MSLRLYNTLTRRLEEFVPKDPSRVTFYSCGPTVYDDAHIGNFRSFLAADVLRRWVESPWCELASEEKPTPRPPPSGRGRKVIHVMNITDVGHMTDDAEGGEHGEDRMAVAGRRIAEAKKAGKLPAGVSVDPSDPYQIARFYESRFKEDAMALGLKLVLEAEKDPSLMPRATENIAGMISMVQRLIAGGHAYVVGSPGSRVVYFRVQSFAPYGRLSGNTLDKLREGEGGRISAENQAGKEHPADFLLWKEDASHIMKWDSPWGKGYPGWHIECSVMSLNRLVLHPSQKEGSALNPSQRERQGEGLSSSSSSSISLQTFTTPNGEPLIDLHSGGEDNIFPHHECEIAQSCCAFNQKPELGTYARLWFHPRFLLVEGTKMSKSKGNFFTARDLFAKGYEPAAIRLELIKTHYRSNANFTEQGLKDSQRTVERWRRYVETAKKSKTPTPALSQREREREEARRAFVEAMHDDLNVAGAIAAVNTLVNECPDPGPAEAELMAGFDAVLGVLELETAKSAMTEIGVFMDGLSPDPAVIAKLESRRAARAAKDFKTSDVIRDELLAMGYAIKDVAGGKVEVRRR